jgi:hypothetical protein
VTPNEQRADHDGYRRKRRAEPSHGWRLGAVHSGMSAAVSVISW